MPPKSKICRHMFAARLDDTTHAALRAKAAALGTSQANAIGVMLGTLPESAYAAREKTNAGLVTR